MHKYQREKASLHNPFKHISNISMQFYTQWKTMSTVRSMFHSHHNLTFIKLISKLLVAGQNLQIPSIYIVILHLVKKQFLNC